MALRLTAALLGTVALIAAAGGCGEGGSEEPKRGLGPLDREQTTVLRTLKHADEAFARERYERACSYYTAGAQSRLLELTGAASCLGALAVLDFVLQRTVSREDLEALAKDKPESVEVRGDSATVAYGPPPRSVRDTIGSEETEIELAKIRGRWLIQSFTGLQTGTVA